jgi:phosphohistidine phosphatase
MLLYIMRHGPAEDRAATGRDADRSLTPEGRAVVRRMAGELRDARPAELPRIVTSPLTRARETAELVRDTAYPDATIDLDDSLGIGGTLHGGAMGLVRRLVAAGSDAMIVGHQPTLGELLAELSASAGARLPGFSTAMIVELAHVQVSEVSEESPSGSFRLVRVLDPRR